MLLGCIGDDFTGSSDLANTLAKQGMRTVLFSGVPEGKAEMQVEAGVVALKSRSNAVDEAIAQSLNALHWLQSQGCTQFFFKYCSTFDSTPEGNIGPVAEALVAELKADRVIVCPAFPGTGRSLYQGHLFVNDRLLNESGMENHPITPMTDSDIRRVMQAQCTSSVAHVSHAFVNQGADAIKTRLAELHDNNHTFMVVDAIDDNDLFSIGQAAADLRLVTGGSGVALGLPANFEAVGKISGKPMAWQGSNGPVVALSGSCSNATREQVTLHSQTNPAYEIDVEAVISNTLKPESVVNWALEQHSEKQDSVPLVYSSADPEKVNALQAKYTQAKTSSALEQFFALLAQQLVAAGVTRLISAGGETSGAIVESLNLRSLDIGPEIDPGVPALRANDTLMLALKSGNFGSTDFFSKASRQLAAGS